MIAHEILGVDLFETRRAQHISNFIELPIYLLFMSPYIVLGIRFMKRVIRGAEDKKSKYKYWLLIVGAVTIIPDFILKIDYGKMDFCCSYVFYNRTIYAHCKR